MFRCIVPTFRASRVPVLARMYDPKKRSTQETNEEMDFENLTDADLEDMFSADAMNDDSLCSHNANKAVPGEKRVLFGDLIKGDKPVDTSRWRLKVPPLKLTMVKYSPTSKTYDIVQAMADQHFAETRHVVIGYVGCFFPVCSGSFLYDWARAAPCFKNQIGFDGVIATSINDPYVVQRFAQKLDFGDRISFIADWAGEWTQFLEGQLPEKEECKDLGPRGTLYAGVIIDGEVRVVHRSVLQRLMYTSGVAPNFLWRYCRTKHTMKRVFL